MGLPRAYRPPNAKPRGKQHNTNNNDNCNAKQKGLSLEELATILRNDWRADTPHHPNKGYYLTGRLTTAIYRDDCLFLGPDPDLPLRGLRKYLGVAAHLFEYQSSKATLTSLKIVEPKAATTTANHHSSTDSIDNENDLDISTIPSTLATAATLVATWELEGVLRLPWKPKLPHLSGQTIYHTDGDGLVACHEEEWFDCSAPRAFCATFLPGLAAHIWPGSNA
jgi:hypothetical protein